MRRIIQKYQEGGVVQSALGPAVATGIPQGGHAAAAIQSYLSGQAAGPLSYTAVESTLPDFRALAAIEKARRLAEQDAAAAAAAVTTVVNNDSNDDSGSDWDGGGYSEQDYGYTPEEIDVSYLSNNVNADGTIGDDTAITIDSLRNTNSGLDVNTSDNAIMGDISADGNWQQVVNPGTNAITRTWVGGGNNDNDSSSTTTTTSNSGGGWADSGWNPKNWNNGGDVTSDIQRYNNGSTGGVSIAKSGNEEEIRQRQLMQSPLPQVQASPLSKIGSQLAMGAIDKGIGSAASSMVAKEGLIGTLGTALGGTAATGAATAATGAATGAAGAGMMAALGPIGIGIGLGKLFGLFNDGGKVPCSCGKTSCKCAKEIKSPLSGE